jgi:hypothetical protein
VEVHSETIKALQNINLTVAACSAAAVDGLALARAELPLHPPSLCPFIQVRTREIVETHLSCSEPWFASARCVQRGFRQRAGDGAQRSRCRTLRGSVMLQ